MSDDGHADTLESFVMAAFGNADCTLSLDDAEFLSRFVEEEMEVEDKKEGFMSMVEGFLLESDTPMPSSIDELFESISAECEARRVLLADDSESSESDDGDALTVKNILDTLTPDELAAAQKAAILRQYAYVDQEDDPTSARYADGPGRIGALATKEEKAADERRKLIEQALKLDSRKKKYKKQQEVDLLAPNLNAAKVAYAAQMQREAARNQAKDKKDRDRAALEKQKADIVKAKADKQKKAAKVERRA